ncbi:MAG TPA: hypothetical protein DEB40_09450 [Elusimicrobia bacterium]|nr:hypothetical protein [Elusimicrobiota bacterium]HBT61955.1 hypothetical protein [Elusimicrobiota bacterium]
MIATLFLALAAAAAAAPSSKPLSLPTALAGVKGVTYVPPAGDGVAAERAIRVSDNSSMRGSESVTVDLREIIHRHLTHSESFVHGGKKFYLSTQINMKGDGFLSVLAEGWEDPKFFKLDANMQGAWSENGVDYLAEIDASLLRKRYNNYLLIRNQGNGKTLVKRKLSDFFFAGYRSGRDAVIGGRKYKVFFSNDVDTSVSPARPNKKVYGICLLFDKSDGKGYHDIKPYLISPEAIQGPKPVGYQLYNKQVLYFHLAADGYTLTISD